MEGCDHAIFFFCRDFGINCLFGIRYVGKKIRPLRDRLRRAEDSFRPGGEAKLERQKVKWRQVGDTQGSVLAH